MARGPRMPPDDLFGLGAPVVVSGESPTRARHPSVGWPDQAWTRAQCRRMRSLIEKTRRLAEMRPARVSKTAAILQCLMVMLVSGAAFRPISVVTVASAADRSSVVLLPGSDERGELLIHLTEADVKPGLEEKWSALGAVEVIPIFQVDPGSEAERELGLGRFLLV